MNPLIAFLRSPEPPSRITSLLEDARRLASGRRLGRRTVERSRTVDDEACKSLLKHFEGLGDDQASPVHVVQEATRIAPDVAAVDAEAAARIYESAAPSARQLREVTAVYIIIIITIIQRMYN